MKTTRHLSRMLTVLAVMAGVRWIVAQSGNTLLLPFPKDGGGTAPSSQAKAPAIPGREAAVPAGTGDDTRRALELADTFLRRSQSEVTNSAPRGGLTSPRVPARLNDAPPRPIARAAAPPPITLIAPQITGAPALDTGAGPSSELLPLPGDESAGAPDSTVLPDAAAMLPPGRIRQTEGDSAPLPVEGSLPPESNGVSRQDLAPGPAYGSIETQERRGPIFRINGADAIKLARSRGYKFTPAGGIGDRDGNRTAAAQFRNVLTSEVNGTRMSQLRPPSNWKMDEISNTFFMFCDGGYSATPLAAGWRIRGIRLEGPAWNWVICPRSGANTASFSIRIHAYKGQEIASSVQLAGLTLEGPEGASDWEDAFPDLTRGNATPPGSPPSVPDKVEDTPPAAIAKGKGSGVEPPLPE